MLELFARMNEATPLGYQLAFLIRVLVATLCDVLVDKVQDKVPALRYLLRLRGIGLLFLGHCLTLLIVNNVKAVFNYKGKPC